MKLPARTLLNLLLVDLAAAGSALAGDAPRNDNPVDPARYDAILARVHCGEYSALSELADTNSRKAIALLRHFIIPQSDRDDRYAVAAGAALAKMHAEKELYETLQGFSRAVYPPSMNEWLEAFDAFAFMRSKATVRLLGALLSDEKPLKLADGFRIGVNAEGAALTLARMNIPGAPPIDWQLLGITGDDFQKLKAWWAANQDKFQGDGPLPGDSNTSNP